MDMNRMTLKLQEALQSASSHAMRRSHQGIDVEHLFVSLLDQGEGITGPLLEQTGVALAAVRNAAEQALAKLPQVQGAGAGPGQIHITSRLSQVLSKAEQEMEGLRDGGRAVTAEDLRRARQALTPLAESRAEEIAALREWARARAQRANSPAAAAAGRRALDLGSAPSTPS